MALEKLILSEIVKINVHEIPTGYKAFDWTVPMEWNIKDAFVENSSGERVIDFKNSNLHVIGYSVPFSGTISRDELLKHIITDPKNPDSIPYATSYYKEAWGFCLAHDDLYKLCDQKYNVSIDSSLSEGHLTYGEYLIPGLSSKEILISSNICHPSLANNEISGPIVSSFLAKHLLGVSGLKYSYRFVFVPETIGAIVFIHKNLCDLRKNVIAGYTVTCCGDRGPFSYLMSKHEHSLVNRITLHILRHTESDYKVYDFLERGSDERQYCSVGVDIGIGSLMRSKYARYKEYHNSSDNLSFISEDSMHGTLQKYIKCIEAIERNDCYISNNVCEPLLSKYSLYETTSTSVSGASSVDLINVLAFCDGEHDLLWIAERLQKPIWELYDAVDALKQNGLIRAAQ
jgi:aminopeptidase-like protein